MSEELSDNSEWLLSVDSEIASWSVESLVSVSEGGKITSVLIADSLESIALVVITAILSFASCELFNGARMGSECLRDAVSLPDVELHAARSVFASSGVRVRFAWIPSFFVSFSIDEFDVMRALSITVSNTVLSSSLVVSSASSILWHLREVDGSVESTWHL